MSPPLSIFYLQRQGPDFDTVTVLNCDCRVLNFKFELADLWSSFAYDHFMTSALRP